MTDPHYVKELKAIYTGIDRETPPAIRASTRCPSRPTNSPSGPVPFEPHPFLLEVDLIRAFLREEEREWPDAEIGGDCIFKKDGCCSVHEARPFECRVAASVDLHQRWKSRVEGLCSQYAQIKGRPLVCYPICMYCFKFTRRRTAVPDST